MLTSSLLIEDNSEVRGWLSDLLHRAFPGVTVTEAGTVAAARKKLADQLYTLMLVDIGLPDGSGIDLVHEIRERQPDSFAVVTTIFDDDAHLFAALTAGAHGYLLKEQPEATLIAQLRRVIAGDPPLSPSIARRILQHFQLTPPPPPASPLSERETDVLRLVAKGLGRVEVGSLLGISPNTVAGHIKNVYRKLNINSRAEATQEAIRLGLMRLTD
jgi:DNA-binding NarL/FixJ family response regulator